jgi:hypothetical protein
VGLIDEVLAAGEVVRRMHEECRAALARGATLEFDQRR